jgi:hypothetical protein
METIIVEINGTATWDSLAGKPTTFAPAAHNQASTTITPVAPQAATYANPLVIDATTYKDWKCAAVSGNTTVNLTNMSDGDGGYIELIITGAGGYTVALGSMFTKNSGAGTIDTTAGADNIIAWMVSGSDIIYSISQIS